jgi:hypothetical protein
LNHNSRDRFAAFEICLAYHRDVPPRKLPRRGPLGRAPEGRTPTGGTPQIRLKPAPKTRPVGKPPNPRKPGLVRDVRGGVLKDLFEFFPDLPRPTRPGRRRKARIRGGR